MKTFKFLAMTFCLCTVAFSSKTMAQDTIRFTWEAKATDGYKVFQVYGVNYSKTITATVDWGDGIITTDTVRKGNDCVQPKKNYSVPDTYNVTVTANETIWSFVIDDTSIGKNIHLTSIDVSQCANLERLYCAENPLLTSLDVSGLTKLKTLYCRTDNLTSLNISGCNALEYLDVTSNKLTSLDVNHCKNLDILYCGKNQLVYLDLAGLNKLKTSYTSIGQQNVSLTLYKNEIGEYTLPIVMNEPTFSNNAISYENGILKSTNKTVKNTDFVAETGFVDQLWGTMNFTYSEGTGITNTANPAISVYPNPTTGKLKIESGENKGINPLVIEVYDITGRKIVNCQLSIVNSIDISHLPTGIYYVKVKTSTGEFVQKIIKKNL